MTHAKNGTHIIFIENWYVIINKILGGFPIEFKTKIRYHIIGGFPIKIGTQISLLIKYSLVFL